MRSTQLGIGADAEIAGITGMQRIEEMQRGERSCRPAARTSRQSARRRSLASCDQRVPPRIKIGDRAAPRSSSNFAMSAGARRGLDRHIGRRIIDADTLGQHVLGQADDDRPRPAVRGV